MSSSCAPTPLPPQIATAKTTPDGNGDGGADLDLDVLALSPRAPLECDVCGRRFHRVHNLRKHRRLHAASRTPLEPGSGEPAQPPTKKKRRLVFVCPEPSCPRHDPAHAIPKHKHRGTQATSDLGVATAAVSRRSCTRSILCSRLWRRPIAPSLPTTWSCSSYHGAAPCATWRRATKPQSPAATPHLELSLWFDLDSHSHSQVSAASVAAAAAAGRIKEQRRLVAAERAKAETRRQAQVARRVRRQAQAELGTAHALRYHAARQVNANATPLQLQTTCCGCRDKLSARVPTVWAPRSPAT